MVNKAEQLIQALNLIQPRVQQNTGTPVLDTVATIKQSIAQHGLLSVLIQDSSAMADKSFRSTLLVLPSPNKHPDLPAGSIIEAKLNTALPRGAVLMIQADKGQLVIQAPKDTASKTQQIQVAIQYLTNQLTNQAPEKPVIIRQINQLIQQLPTPTKDALVQVLTGQSKPTTSADVSKPKQAQTNPPAPALQQVRQQTSLLAGFTQASKPSLQLPTQQASNTAPLSQLASVLQWLQSNTSEAKTNNLLPQLLAHIAKQTPDLLQMQAASMAMHKPATSGGQPLLNFLADTPESRLPQLLNGLLQHQTVAQLQHAAVNLQTDSPLTNHWLPFFHNQTLKAVEYDIEASEATQASERTWRVKVYFTLPPLAAICAELRFNASSLALTLWSETPQTLKLLQAHTETLQALLNNHVQCQPVACQYGMPPKKKKPDNPQQQVDIKA